MIFFWSEIATWQRCHMQPYSCIFSRFHWDKTSYWYCHHFVNTYISMSCCSLTKKTGLHSFHGSMAEASTKWSKHKAWLSPQHLALWKARVDLNVEMFWKQFGTFLSCRDFIWVGGNHRNLDGKVWKYLAVQSFAEVFWPSFNANERKNLEISQVHTVYRGEC